MVSLIRSAPGFRRFVACLVVSVWPYVCLFRPSSPGRFNLFDRFGVGPDRTVAAKKAPVKKPSATGSMVTVTISSSGYLKKELVIRAGRNNCEKDCGFSRHVGDVG